MNNNTNKNSNPYGHLLYEYLDGTYLDYRTDEQRAEEAKERYGHLLDDVKPDNSALDNMLEVYKICERMNQCRKEESERNATRSRERFERERREKEQHDAEVAAYAESLIERMRAEEEAKAKAEAERRKKAEEQQELLDRVRWMVDMGDHVEKVKKETEAMLAYQKEKDEKYKKEMEWYEKQQEYMKKRKW